MEEGLDTGPMLSMQSVAISDDDTTGSLHDTLAALGGRMIVDALARLERDDLAATPQPDAGANYAPKIAKDEAALDFALPAEVLARKIRAFNPFPGATGRVGENVIKLWQARPVTAAIAGTPGQVLSADAQAGIVVACGSGALLLTELQKPGGKRLAAGEFLKGFALAGAQFS